MPLTHKEINKKFSAAKETDQTKDYHTAISLYQELAEEGHAPSLYNLACLYIEIKDQQKHRYSLIATHLFQLAYVCADTYELKAKCKEQLSMVFRNTYVFKDETEEYFANLQVFSNKLFNQFIDKIYTDPADTNLLSLARSLAESYQLISYDKKISSENKKIFQKQATEFFKIAGSNIEALPDELLLYIFKCLKRLPNPKDSKKAIAQVSRRWYLISQEKSLNTYSLTFRRNQFFALANAHMIKDTVLFIGPKGAGKTTLINKLSPLKPRAMVFFEMQDFSNLDYSLSVLKRYYLQARVIVLVADYTQNYASNRLKKFLKDCKTYAPNAPIILAINKSSNLSEKIVDDEKFEKFSFENKITPIFIKVNVKEEIKDLWNLVFNLFKKPPVSAAIPQDRQDLINFIENEIAEINNSNIVTKILSEKSGKLKGLEKLKIRLEKELDVDAKTIYQEILDKYSGLKYLGFSTLGQLKNLANLASSPTPTHNLKPACL